MNRKEKIRWILAIVFSATAIVFCIMALDGGIQILLCSTVQEETASEFSLLGKLTGSLLLFAAVFLASVISFSSAALGAFFSYSFRNSAVRYGKLTCRILFIVDILCVVGAAGAILSVSGFGGGKNGVILILDLLCTAAAYFNRANSTFHMNGSRGIYVSAYRK